MQELERFNEGHGKTIKANDDEVIKNFNEVKKDCSLVLDTLSVFF